MEINVFSVDLAKNKFQVHGYDARGEKRLGKTLKRAQFLEFFRQWLGRCEVVMEACGGAHHWGRCLLGLGYRVRLIPAQFVRPFVIGNKTDSNDADAIYEASRSKKVRPVPVKRLEQQDALLAHTTREQWVKMRTALVNQIRGELAERGIVYDKGIAGLRSGLKELLSQAGQGEVSETLLGWLAQRQADWSYFDTQIKTCERQMKQHYQTAQACDLIGQAPGIGLITATATVALVGHAGQFDSARHFGSWLGLTPKEHSSGERRQLGGLTGRGDVYLRKLYVHGGRSVVQAALRKRKAGLPLHERDRWIAALADRRGFNKACVAVANKNARIVWAMLTSGECYRPPAMLAA
jgi:transposase